MIALNRNWKTCSILSKIKKNLQSQLRVVSYNCNKLPASWYYMNIENPPLKPDPAQPVYPAKNLYRLGID